MVSRAQMADQSIEKREQYVAFATHWGQLAKDRVGKFGAIDPDVPHRHHDAIEFPDGSNVLVTQLAEGQRVTVLQLPVVHQVTEHAQSAADTNAATPVS